MNNFMIKRLPAFLIAGLLVFICTLAVTQRPQDFYPVVDVEITGTDHPLALSFLFHNHYTLQSCETITGNIARAVLKQCPPCRIKQLQCEATLDGSRQTLFSGDPLPAASGRMINGVVLFHTTNPELALATCQETEIRSATGDKPIKCYPANTQRDIPTAQSILSPWYLILLLSAFAAAWFAGWLIVKYEHLHARYSHDHVNSGPQKYHTAPTPRIGGLAVKVGLLAAGGVMLFSDDLPVEREFGLLLLAGITAFLGGLVEDITKKVGVLERLLLTMVSGAIAAWLLGAVLLRLEVPVLDEALLWLPFAVALTAFAVGGIANSINIIDGYNGLAGGFALIVLAAFAYVAYLVGDSLIFSVALALSGALLGFLFWNWPSGRIFLGDGGAYLLGFLLAELSVLLVVRNPEVSPWFPMLLLIYPVFETFFSIYRKLKHGLSPGQPDNKHLHQLIHDNVVACHVDISATQRIHNTNSAVAKYFWAPAVAMALFAVTFWQSTAALITAAISYCVFYVTVYRNISIRKAVPSNSPKSSAA